MKRRSQLEIELDVLESILHQPYLKKLQLMSHANVSHPLLEEMLTRLRKSGLITSSEGFVGVMTEKGTKACMLYRSLKELVAPREK